MTEVDNRGEGLQPVGRTGNTMQIRQVAKCGMELGNSRGRQRGGEKRIGRPVQASRCV